MTEFRDLPTIVRRSFEAFVQRFQDDHPGSSLRRTSEPYLAYLALQQGVREEVWAIPFEDAPSGAKYEVAVNVAGAVFDPKQLA